MIEGQTDEYCHTTGEQITFILPYQAIEKSRFLFLGQAIYWIMSRGRLANFENADEEWGRYTECAHELFDNIDNFRPHIEGYQKGRDGENENLPGGIWANMRMEPVNIPGTMGKFFPIFSSIDPGEDREDGGHVMVGEKEWYGVRIPTSFVLERWPLISQASPLTKMSSIASYKRWLANTVSASPHLSTHTKVRLKAEASKHGISGKQAEIARGEVLNELSNRGLDISAWRSAGRPKNHSDTIL
ncbi:hypothetical protein LAV78_01160 [Brucella intermedia]|uniref:hypothetical protein n=1 Tax=Brucella intermedia TaxID=94625 RepID=UPI001E60557C|nr:hypothetical protein [Brucella intermedia]MCB4917132.1 hypothetical protein [Brucella intermedia]